MRFLLSRVLFPIFLIASILDGGSGDGSGDGVGGGSGGDKEKLGHHRARIGIRVIFRVTTE